MSTRPREMTCRLLEVLDEGLLDKDRVINACLSYMSEAEVKDMCEVNEFFTLSEEGEGK